MYSASYSAGGWHRSDGLRFGRKSVLYHGQWNTESQLGVRVHVCVSAERNAGAHTVVFGVDDSNHRGFFLCNLVYGRDRGGPMGRHLLHRFVDGYEKRYERLQLSVNGTGTRL